MPDRTNFGRVIARIGQMRGLGAIIQPERIRSLLGPRRDVSMKAIPGKLSLDQKDRIEPKLRYLFDHNVEGRVLQDAKSLKELFDKSKDQIDYLFKPDAVAFVRNLGPKLAIDKTFSLKVPDASLSISKDTSPIFLSIRQGFTVYVADTKKGPIILANGRDEFFEADKGDPDIKLNKKLSSRYGSLLVAPIYMQGADIALGSVVMLWSKEDAIDPADYLIELRVARRLAGFVAPTLFEQVARQNI